MAYKLYIKIKMRGTAVKEQIQWVLSYIQRGSVDIWKKNILEDLERGLLDYDTIGEFLADIRKEFGREDKESTKVVKLKKVEQGNRMMKEFVQEFRRAARESEYKERLLIKEFKWGMNKAIQRKLMKAEC